jgi:hypothetical protein
MFIFKHQNPYRYAQNAGFCIKYLKNFKEGACPQNHLENLAGFPGLSGKVEIWTGK